MHLLHEYTGGMAYYAVVQCHDHKHAGLQAIETDLALPGEDLTCTIRKPQQNGATIANYACCSCRRLHSNAVLQKHVYVLQVLHSRYASPLHDGIFANVHAIYVQVVVVSLQPREQGVVCMQGLRVAGTLSIARLPILQEDACCCTRRRVCSSLRSAVTPLVGCSCPVSPCADLQPKFVRNQ